jgi:hypothetical protein
MDESNENGFGWETYVWRGALGGVVGSVLGVLLAAAYVVLRFGSGTLRDLLVIGGVFALAGGAIAGLTIGYVIYRVARKRGRPGVLTRTVIGFAGLLVFSLLLNVTNLDLSRFVFDIAYALLVGGVAGLMARDKPSSAPVAISAGRA